MAKRLTKEERDKLSIRLEGIFLLQGLDLTYEFNLDVWINILKELGVERKEDFLEILAWECGVGGIDLETIEEYL